MPSYWLYPEKFVNKQYESTKHPKPDVNVGVTFGVYVGVGL